MKLSRRINRTKLNLNFIEFVIVSSHLDFLKRRQNEKGHLH